MSAFDDLSPLDRQWAESRLSDSCRITNPATGEPVWDDDLGRTVPVSGAQIYDGPCLHSTMVTERRISPGADPQIEADHLVKVPVTATGIVSGATIQVYAVGEMGDPDIIGKPIIVVKNSKRSHAALRRLECIEREQTGTAL